MPIVLWLDGWYLLVPFDSLSTFVGSPSHCFVDYNKSTSLLTSQELFKSCYLNTSKTINVSYNCAYECNIEIRKQSLIIIVYNVPHEVYAFFLFFLRFSLKINHVLNLERELSDSQNVHRLQSENQFYPVTWYTRIHANSQLQLKT